MYNFQFFMPTKVLFGAGQLQNLHFEQMPGNKALVVTSNGQSTKKFGYLAATEKELELAGVEHVLFDEIRPNPTRKNVMDGAAKAKAEGCDFVVALGGGSVMDAAKCIALMMVNDGDLWDYAFLPREDTSHSRILRNLSSPLLPTQVQAQRWICFPLSVTTNWRRRQECSTSQCSRPFL